MTLRPFILFAFFVLLCSVVLSSCTITKRKYRKGYYIESQQRSGSNESTSGTTDSPDSADTLVVQTVQPIEKETVIPPNPPADTIKCDIIYLVDGSRIEAKVIEIGDKEITYKKCRKPDGPTYVSNVNAVEEVRLSNGEAYVYKNTDTKSSNTNRKDTKKEQSRLDSLMAFIFALLALTFMLLGLIFTWYFALPAMLFGLLAVILGGKGLKKGFRGMAIAAIIIGGICFLIAGIQLIGFFLN